MTLRQFKWGSHSPHRTGFGFVRTSTPSTIEVFVPHLNDSASYDGSLFNTYSDGIYWFDRLAWHNIIEGHRRGGYWYCNVATPVYVERSRLSWIDLDIDVEFFGDGSWWIADIPEFTDRNGRYPTSVVDSTIRAVEELIRKFVDGEHPFVVTPSGSGYSSYDHVFWSSPRAGDGVAVVDPTLASSAVATRVLQAFAPRRAHSMNDPIATGRQRSIPPRDGLLVIGSDSSPVDTIGRARAWANALALSKSVHVVIVRGKPLNPIEELEDSVRPGSGHGRLLLDVNSAISQIPGAIPYVASARDMVAAGWF
ncbi:MAG: DUF402 domain-containing protein [Chloroflexi bacterium]|nr:DUF402 domain-containing protein [Chloroflexota bacterium]